MLKHTKQKEVILRVLRSTNSHPTALWIYDGVRRELPHVSLATVYRNLRQLAGRGEVLELQFGGPLSHFEGRTDKHNHFICDSCGHIFDVDGPVDGELNDQIAQKTGFKISHYRLVFYGICRECELALRL